MPSRCARLRQRIEQIGERHAGDERQQDSLSSQSKRDEHSERREPEHHLPLQRPLRTSVSRPRAGAHQPLRLRAEFMWRTHSAR